jgi:hypothetical protein
MADDKKTTSTVNQPGGIAAAAGQPMFTAGVPSEIQYNLRQIINGGITDAEVRRNVENELADLVDSYGLEYVKGLFPETKGAMEEQCLAVKKGVAQTVHAFHEAPYAGSPAVLAMQNMLESGLQASLVGQPIERLPAYESFIPICLMTSSAKDFTAARNGTDPIEYEDPIGRSTAFNFDPENGGGVRVEEISGNRSTIYPYHKITPRHTLSFWEWNTRQIKPIVIKKRQLTQELAKGWDDDLITHFDAVVPNGTLYSSHPTHTETINNAANAVTQTKFKDAARLIEHVDSASGIAHTAIPGVALCDILALRDIEAWGSDVWTEIEVSDYAKNAYAKIGESLRTGKRLYEYALIKTPIETSSTNRKVRFFGRKEQVGVFVPVTVNGRRLHVNIGPMSGQDPDVNALRSVTAPPGYTFYMEAWNSGAIQIINPYAISRLNHT